MRANKSVSRLCLWIGVGVAMMLIAFLLSSCRSVQLVPMETVKLDSIYINKVLHDSIYQRDSIYVNQSGDTIYIYRDKYIYRYKFMADTLFINKVDTIRTPFPVEKKISGWEKFEMYAGGAAIGILLAIILALTAWIVYKLKKK